MLKKNTEVKVFTQNYGTLEWSSVNKTLKDGMSLPIVFQVHMDSTRTKDGKKLEPQHYLKVKFSKIVNNLLINLTII